MTSSPSENWNLERENCERERAVAAFGFTERQARFLVDVMIHGGVFVPRQYCAFAGIAHGQKVHDFLRKLVERGYARPIQVGALHRGRLFHVRHKPLYEAIDEPDNRHRKPMPLGRMVERLMVFDLVLADHAFAWLGTEKDKHAYFRRLCGDQLEDRELPHLTFGSGATQVRRYFPDKLPVGIELERIEHVFVYLVTSAVPLDFRQFLYRHAELLRTLTRWTIRVLVPQPFAKAIPVFRTALREELATPITPAASEELQWFFRERRRLKAARSEPKSDRFRVAASQFRQPRFGVLYRLWEVHGDAVIWAAQSPTLRDALDRRDGRVEFVQLSHQYLHLSSLVGVA